MRTRTPVLVAVLTLGVPMLASPALAEAPSNDNIENATAITALPYMFEQRVSDATKAVGDPRPSCDPGTRGNVWWTVTVTSSGWLVADTGGSRIATVTAIYTGEPGALAEVACNDDTYRDDRYSEQARVYWPAEAGTKYYIMVAKDYGSWGKLKLTVDNSEAPFTVDALAINPSGSVDNQTGVAKLRGTVTCSQGPARVGVEVEIIQRIGRVYIRDFNSKRVSCDGVTPWRMRFVSYEGLFTGGPVEARSWASWRDGNGGYQEYPTTTVTLHGG